MIIIYDGECAFCCHAIGWVQRRTASTCLPFQSADLALYQLTSVECAAAVQVISPQGRYAGARAVAEILRQTRWKVLGVALDLSGFLGVLAYRWIAKHRSSQIVRALNWLIEDR